MVRHSIRHRQSFRPDLFLHAALPGDSPGEARCYVQSWSALHFDRLRYLKRFQKILHQPVFLWAEAAELYRYRMDDYSFSCPYICCF